MDGYDWIGWRSGWQVDGCNTCFHHILCHGGAGRVRFRFASANEDCPSVFKTMNVLATAPIDGVWFAFNGRAAQQRSVV